MKRETVVIQLQKFRSDLHFLAKTISDDFERTRECSTSKTALENAAMFAGNTLKEMNGGDTPYKNSSDPTNTVIDKFHVDQNVDLLCMPADYHTWDYIQKIKWVRLRLELIEGVVKDIMTSYLVEERDGSTPVLVLQLYSFVVTGRNWLGMELGRIRDSKHENG